MDPPQVNILLATFAGLGLPRTLSLPTCPTTSIKHVRDNIIKRLPCSYEGLVITTVSKKPLRSSDNAPIQDLLDSLNDRILSLRLSRCVYGGKGGFGSQLRAAGGRMSSRKNRDRQNQNVNGSNRNLDGRRLRTVEEAKRLAEYLSIKPEMDQREKEERKKRWEAVVEAADRREEEIKSGKAGANQGRLDSEYVESKEAAEEKTREAVLKAMKEGTLQLERTGSESSMDADEDSEDDEDKESSGSSTHAVSARVENDGGRSFFGWDDDEEDSEDDSDAGNVREEESATIPPYNGKGKAKALHSPAHPTKNT